EPRDRYQTASELIVDLERSKLAAAVPSFVDADLALQDPVIRSRLASPAQPTAPDLDSAVRKKGAAGEEPDPNLWYLRDREARGNGCKARATTRQVLQRLREGRMPREVEASHHPQEQFQPLAALPEFREAASALGKRRKPERAGKPAPPARGAAPARAKF